MRRKIRRVVRTRFDHDNWCGIVTSMRFISTVYELTGQPGLTCGEQFLQEEFLPLDQPSEFDFPYIRVSGHQPPHIPADIPHFDECSVPCPIGFAPQPVCGQHGVNGYSAEYHTFSNNCARKCHAKKNPSHGKYKVD